MSIYRVYGTQYDSYELWIEAKDENAATKIAEDAPDEAWLYSGEDFKINPSGTYTHEGSDIMDKKLLYVPEETVMPEGEDKLNWIDLTELATKKYPHLGDDCE